MTAPTFPKVFGLAGNFASSLKRLDYEKLRTLGRFSTAAATVQGQCPSVMRGREFTLCAERMSTSFPIYCAGSDLRS